MSVSTNDNDCISDRPKPSSFRACQICRQRKVKCVAIPGNEATCEYCYRHGVECQAVRPVLKRRRLNTAAELRARVEQLEARLTSTLRERPTRPKWRQLSPEHPRSVGQPLTLPYQSSSQHSPPEFSAQNMTKDIIHFHPQAPLPGKSFDKAPYRSDIYSPLPPPSFNMPDQTIGSQRYSNDRNMDRLDQSFAQILPLPLPSLTGRVDTPTTSFSTSGPRTYFSTMSEQYQRQQGSHEARPSSVQSAPSASGRVRSIPPTPDTYHESSEGKGRLANYMADDGSNDPDFINSDRHHTRILGPTAPFDAEFYELCIEKGLATTDDRDCDAKDKLWTRFYKLSSDPTLPLYKFHFMNSVTSADLKCNIPPEAIAQLEFWTDTYGDVLLQTFIKKIAPRLWSTSDVRDTTKESLRKRSTSHTCAIYALAATCVDSWSIKKRAYLGLSFHRCAMTYLQRALYPVSLDALQTLVLLAAFPLQADSSLLNSWALALAFDMKLNIDPEHWQILEEEKNIRRRLFWLIIVSHRWSAFKHLYPSVSSDCYDTLVPTTQESFDKTFSYEVQVSEIVASIAQSFYSVRGAKMVHHNVEASMVFAKHLETQVIEVQHTLRSSTDMYSSVSLTMLHLNLGIAALMVHRPFLDNKSLNIMDALVHHQKAAQAAIDCVSILQCMPDAYFTEAWPTHSILMLALIAFTLLRESILSKDENLRLRCRDGLIDFMAVTDRQASRWHLSRFGTLITSVAKALSGEDYGGLTTTTGSFGDTNETSPLLSNPSMAPIDNIDFATFEWEHFSQLLGLDTSSLLGDWTQA